MEFFKNIDIQNHKDKEHTADIPPRSRLYCLVPIGKETEWIESLSSYINRLAWHYQVGSSVLITQEVVPYLKETHHIRTSSAHQIGAFFHTGAMSINGGGEVAHDWAQTLGHLTMRADLWTLTIHSWGNNIPSHHLFRNSPAWCPECYDEWKEQEKPLYQPLLWMFQIITICPMHRRELVERCPTCQKPQLVIATQPQLGYCTQCKTWLGESSNTRPIGKISEEMYDWQRWIVNEFARLHQREITPEVPRWKKLPHGIATCVEIIGEARRLANLANVSESLISTWLKGTRTPSFEPVLRLCYVLNISPLQLINNDVSELKEAVHLKEIKEIPFIKHCRPHLEHLERALEFIQAVLDGQESPLGLNQIARHLGISARALARHFPKECALVTVQYKAHCSEMAKQRMAQISDEVRQAILTLHAQGITPSRPRVEALLPNPNIMFKQAARDTWHTVRHELGYE